MQTVKFTLSELNEVNAQINGLRTRAGVIVAGFFGFVNESQVSETQKRRAHKVSKAVQAELTTFEDRAKAIAAWVPEPGETDWSEEKITAEKARRQAELEKDEFSIEVEPLFWSHVADKQLTGNYQTLYDKIFDESK